jgi:Ca-activated chloride channel homolog
VSFDRPDLLFLVLALPAFAAWAVHAHARRRRRAAAALGDPALLARLGLTGIDRYPVARLALLALAAAALGAAAAGPRWGYRTVEERGRGTDIVFALDVSRSMLVEDAVPNRLERQRILARRLLRELPGDRIGLVAYAGRAYILAPLTVDHSALLLFVDALDPEIVSYGGSSLAAAIGQASDLVRGDGPPARERVVVLVGDGEAHEEHHAISDAVDRARRAGVTIHTVGIGTAQGGPVPARDDAAGPYVRGPDGEIAISRLDARQLQDIARGTGGRYVHLDDAGATNRLLAALRGAERGEFRGGLRVERRERYTWFLLVAILALTLDAVLAAALLGRRREELA